MLGTRRGRALGSLGVAIGVAASLVGVRPAAGEAAFTPLGDFPGGSAFSQAFDVSNDGVVVGHGTSAAGFEAFRWSEATGRVGLGDLAGGAFASEARGVSDDGSVVVGFGESAAGQEAFVWTAATGLVGLGDLPGGGFASQARGVSDDGTVIVGFGDGADGMEPFRWTAATGLVGLGSLPGGGHAGQGHSVSGDGLRVVGESYSTSGNQAFLWTAASGMVGLGDLPGGAFFSRAKDISFDGAVVVGISASASGNEAFRWTEATGMVALGDLPGAGVFSQSNTVSGDGSVVGGLGTTGHPGSPFGFEAFVWTAPTGMRNLQALLEDDYGLDLGDWVLEMVVEMSDDARFLAGFGVNPGGTREAFRVELPDSDGDGVIDLVDVCPAVADPGQGDADADGIGDACDLPCDDGVDNDGDGATDFGADLGCRYADWPTESPACQDGVNNDPGMDDEIDWDGGASAGLPPEQQTAPDSHCDAPWRRAEGARNACGLGPEALVSIAVLCAARRRRRGSGDDFEGPLV